MKFSNILGTAATFALCAISAINGVAQQSDPASGTASTTVTNATGTITELNYGDNGGVQGFLVGTNILLSFPMSICGGLSSLGAIGNSVTYSGTAFTATSGFQSVRVTAFTNTTTKATYSAPTSTSTAYGPTSGTVKQLNYGGDGSIDGFVFTASGGTTSIFVSTGARASATLTPLLKAGTTVSVTGTTSVSMGGCFSTGTLEAVDASSLTVSGQTIVIAGNGGDHGGSGGPGGPGGPGGHR